ncbi:MAG: beta-propeller fold lactonase family protein, partial [Tepidisphaeraceae bacterium]
FTILVAAACPAQSLNPAIFVTNNVGDSVTSFTINPNGTLSFVGTIASGDGPQTISLSPDGRFLAVANGTASTTTEELRVFQVNSNATLTLRLTTTVLDSPLDVQWLNNSILAVAQTNLSVANNVRTFTYNDAGPSLTLADTEPTGSFNSRLATARGGSLLFANNTSGSNSIRSISATPGGALSLIDNELSGSLFSVEMGVSHDGNFLYGAGGISGDGNRILGFSIDGGGALAPLAPVTYTSPGESPKVIGLTDDDSILVAGHGTDATFWSFDRNVVTGDITPTGFSFDVGLQGTLADLQIMGNLLFVTDSSTATDGISGVYSFLINPDGSFTQLGPINDTFGTRPEFIATWAGVPEPVGMTAIGLVAIALIRRRSGA